LAYIGNRPVSATFAVDTFSGNGSTDTFTLRYAPASESSILVFVNDVRQNTSSYSLSDANITLSPAPASGTNNIEVVFLGIGSTPYAVGVNSIGESELKDGSVSGNKLQSNIIRANNIVNGTIDNSKLVDANITGAKFVANTITSREIADNAILANNIVNATITANKLAPGAAIANGQLSFVSSAIGLIPDSSSGVSPYKILGQVQPTGNVLTTIYTVPASTNTMVTTITICNQSSNTVSINVAANVSGSAVTTRNFIVTNYSLGGAETLVLEPRISLNVGSMLSANITGANASISNVSINAFGVEII